MVAFLFTGASFMTSAILSWVSLLMRYSTNSWASSGFLQFFTTLAVAGAEKEPSAASPQTMFRPLSVRLGILMSMNTAMLASPVVKALTTSEEVEYHRSMLSFFSCISSMAGVTSSWLPPMASAIATSM